MNNVKEALIKEFNNVSRRMDALDGYNDSDLTRWCKLLDYQNGIRFALDLIEKEDRLK